MNVGFRVPSKVDTEPAERTFDLRQYLNFVWRNWMFIASVTAFAFLVGMIYLVRANPLYTATTQVLLERESPPNVVATANDGGFSSESYLDNQLAILRSDSLLRRVVIKERLAVPPPATEEPQSTDVPKRPIAEGSRSTDVPQRPIAEGSRSTDVSQRPIAEGSRSTDVPQRPIAEEPQSTDVPKASIAEGVQSTDVPKPPIAKELQRTPVPKDLSPSDQSIRNGINSLRSALAVLKVGRAQVLNISVTAENPIRAAQLANGVADAYVVDQLDARLDTAKRASGWLSDRLVELRRQLSESEEAVATFREEHGLARSGPTVALNDQQLSDLNGKLIAARTDAAEKKSRVDYLADLTTGKQTLDSMPDSMLSMSPVIMALRQKLVDASQREADLLARYDSRYPSVVNVAAEKRDLQRSISAEAQRLAQNFQSEYALARMRRDSMEQFMREATGQGELNNDDAVRLRELERSAAVNKTLFEDFLQKLKITGEQSTFRASDVRVIQPAQPGGQSFPDTRKVLLMALIAGLGLGVGGAFAMEMLRAGFTTPREVEAALEFPVLASVHQVTKNDLVKNGKSVALQVYLVQNPLSPFSESLRTLRNSIHMSDVDQPPKIIHVTSALPGEGKTTIAVNLAISDAFSGRRVLLIDADLRHPAASRLFNLEQERGLVDLLMGTATVDDVLQFHKDYKLMIIPAGSKSLNPPDVLGSERMKSLVAKLRETFDYVVIDTPPVGPVVDPVIVAKLADKTIFVVQWASTSRELIESSIQHVSKAKRVAGIVFNFVNKDRAKRYGGEYYYGQRYEKYYS